MGEPHSIYLDADEFKSMKMQTSGTYAGVGMVLGHDDKGLYAVSIMEDQQLLKRALNLVTILLLSMVNPQVI